jgi:hypothetical protein
MERHCCISSRNLGADHGFARSCPAAQSVLERLHLHVGSTEAQFKEGMAYSEVRVKILGYTTLANIVQDAVLPRTSPLWRKRTGTGAP